MPIIGMTRREDVTPKFPELGKLRKGGPKTDAKKPGQDLDYWRFTSERADVQAAWNAAYPGRPQSVDVYLPFARMEDNWQTWYEEYDAGGLKHRCDGRTMYRWRTPAGDYADGERPCPYHNGERARTKENPGCKQVGRLSLVVPQLIKAGYVGFVVMETHSINDLISITACLLDAEEKAGRLTGILFNLLRVKQTISTPAWKEEDKAAGKRNRTVKDLVKIVPAAEWVMARLGAEQQLQMEAARNGGALAAASTHPDLPQNGATDSDNDDAEEGDFEPITEPAEPTPAPKDESLPGPPPANQTTSDAPQDIAPLTADDVRARFSDIIAGQPGQEEPPDPQALKRAKGALSYLLKSSDQRHALTAYLIGDDNPNEWSHAECLALIAWVGLSKVKTDDGQELWLPSEQAVSDARMVLDEVMPVEGADA